ncbi:hypothetical protein D3C72_2337870 [compost metagenome]
MNIESEIDNHHEVHGNSGGKDEQAVRVDPQLMNNIGIDQQIEKRVHYLQHRHVQVVTNDFQVVVI